MHVAGMDQAMIPFFMFFDVFESDGKTCYVVQSSSNVSFSLELLHITPRWIIAKRKIALK